MLLVQDDNDEMEKQIYASLAAVQRPALFTSLFVPSTATRNSPQNGVEYFGSSNIIGQQQQYDTVKVRQINHAPTQPVNLQRQNIPTYQVVNSLPK